MCFLFTSTHNYTVYYVEYIYILYIESRSMNRASDVGFLRGAGLELTVFSWTGQPWFLRYTREHWEENSSNIQ